jgi:hypothetical protein
VWHNGSSAMSKKRQQIPMPDNTPPAHHPPADKRRRGAQVSRVARRPLAVQAMPVITENHPGKKPPHEVTEHPQKSPPPRRPSSAPHRIDLDATDLGRRSPFTLDQEKMIRYYATRIYQEKFKDATPRPQEMMGKALANLSQSSVSAVLLGKQTLSVERAELLAKLAGFESLRAMIGEFGLVAAVSDQAGSGTVAGGGAVWMQNLKKCVDYFGENNWPAWVVAAARAGIFGAEDVSPKEWERRLHALGAYMAKFKQPKADA